MRIILTFVCLLGFIHANAQPNGHKLISQQKKQENVIKSAYRKHKITETEYRKLLNEQDVIKHAIKKYKSDGIWTSHELNVVAGKLDRAESRLKRYKTNSEVN